MRVLYVSLLVVLADQITKLTVKGISIPFLGIDHIGMNYGQSISVFGDWFKITYIENPNMAFSLEIGGKLFLSIFAIIASIVLVIYLYKNREQPLKLRLALALILAGAIGNLIDRTFYGVIFNTAAMFEGSVVDFINFDLFTVNFGSRSFRFWPIFNIADTAVACGVGLLLLATRAMKQVEEKKPGSGAEQVSSEQKDKTVTDSTT